MNVDFDKILEKHENLQRSTVMMEDSYVIRRVVLAAMKEVWNDAIETAADSADFGISQNDNGCPCIWESHFIDKVSILKLKV